jgi:2-polyprenyl-3-methyl-5-hydroxy-6-metoxy-1,4-benzoquinol methylase
LTTKEEWQTAQAWERNWWGICANTYGEEEKQLVYAMKMGLKTFYNEKSAYNFDITGNILDIGGGPISMLLKCPNATGTVADPCAYPAWVYERYKMAGIKFEQVAGEEIGDDNHSNLNGFDEVWIYNVLQHVLDPMKIINNALNAGKLIRMFEWVETEINMGHHHILTKDKLDEWLKGYGKTEEVSEHGCFGKCYFGIFKGNSYAK